MPYKLGIVITTINSPSPRLLEWLKLPNSTLIVVGDTSTPHSEWYEFCDANRTSRLTYLDCDSQELEFPRLSRALGWRTYSRKNIGYLFAKKIGCSDILETDDDTFPRSLLQTYHLDKLQPTVELELTDHTNFWNPYEYFAPGSALWGRGTPLARIKSGGTGAIFKSYESGTSFHNDAHIVQFLVDNEPDLDAIYRLTQPEIIHNFEESADLVLVPKGTFAPANTQATIWRNIQNVDALYFPSTVSLRIADILKMYLAQAQQSLVYGGFNVRQERNPHDFFVDFVQEVQMYLDVDKWINLLSTDNHKLESTRQMYELFVENNLIPRQELVMLDAYLAKE